MSVRRAVIASYDSHDRPTVLSTQIPASRPGAVARASTNSCPPGVRMFTATDRLPRFSDVQNRLSGESSASGQRR